MQTLSMGLHLGICGEDEKTSKKKIILNYLNTHRMVSVFNMRTTAQPRA